MARTNVVGAAAASTSLRRSRPRLAPSHGSFHAGDIIPSSLTPYDMGDSAARRRSYMRRQPSNKYTTFPTQPPKTPSGAPEGTGSGSPSGDSDVGASRSRAAHEHGGEPTPLPLRQLGLLALLSLCEQTALNSISPYLPTMVASFEEIPDGQTGLYVGLLASAFALAQLATNLMWGYQSDAVGRKPVMLLGTSLLMVCFAFFGFCTAYWQVVVVHVAMGLLNGNAAVVPTCLGEVTDRTNQSRAFTWLPVMYSIGSITGPALGGLLVGEDGATYRFLGPNIGSAALLLAAVVVLGIWFEETLDDAGGITNAVGLGWILKMCGRGKRGRQGSWSSRWPTRRGPGGDGRGGPGDCSSSSSDDGDNTREDQSLLRPSSAEAYDGAAAPDDGKEGRSVFRQLLNHMTVLVLLTYLVFQLANISFNSLYPIFVSAPPPTGRGLPPETIGLLLSFAGFVTIVFQIFLFQPLKTRVGNLQTYRGALLGLAASMALMPWVGYLDGRPPLGVGSGKGWLYGEIAVVLVVKNICAVGGLSSVLLLITNSAPSHETLGTLNGIAQTLSAAGRSVGPFLSGSLFTLSTGLEPKGELLAWGLFGGIALMGWLGSLAIRGDGLESADWVDGEEDDDWSDEGEHSPGEPDVERRAGETRET